MIKYKFVKHVQLKAIFSNHVLTLPRNHPKLAMTAAWFQVRQSMIRLSVGLSSLVWWSIVTQNQKMLLLFIRVSLCHLGMQVEWRISAPCGDLLLWGWDSVKYPPRDRKWGKIPLRLAGRKVLSLPYSVSCHAPRGVPQPTKKIHHYFEGDGI